MHALKVKLTKMSVWITKCVHIALSSTSPTYTAIFLRILPSLLGSTFHVYTNLNVCIKQGHWFYKCCSSHLVKSPKQTFLFWITSNFASPSRVAILAMYWLESCLATSSSSVINQHRAIVEIFIVHTTLFKIHDLFIYKVYVISHIKNTSLVGWGPALWQGEMGHFKAHGHLLAAGRSSQVMAAKEAIILQLDLNSQD